MHATSGPPVRVMLLTNRCLLLSSRESLRKAGTYHPASVARSKPAASGQQQQQQQQQFSSSSSSNVGEANSSANMSKEAEQKESAAAAAKVVVDKQELKSRLTPLQWHVTQEKGTERPFTGCYNKHYEGGVYTCIVCEHELFSSDAKYDSGCGWPAFNDVLEQGRVKLSRDNTLDMVRTEVTCAQCGAHLGHVFNDGPKPKRKRFCINSASLNFHPAAEAANAAPDDKKD